MSLLEQIIVAIIAGLILAAIFALRDRLWRKFFRPELRIWTAIEQGPTSREFGFTEPAVKITVANKSSESIQIKDIRLMFSGDFGASILAKAPAGRSHRELPASLDSGADNHWYIPAEQLLDFLRGLHHLPEKNGSATCNLKLYPRCTTGTGKVYKGSSFNFSAESLRMVAF